MSIGIEKLTEKIITTKVFVVGDVMLDCYWWGNIGRISPEAPVPILDLTKKEERLGGAANVALNTVALGCETHIYTVIGKDSSGDSIKNMLAKNKIETDGLFVSDVRKTTTKTRLISKNHHIARIDEEIIDDLIDEHAFIDFALKGIQREKPNVVILEDYNKGVLTEYIIKKIIEHCNIMHIPICVDPKSKNFFEYKNVTLFKPNLKEVLHALHFSENENINLDFLNKIKENLNEKIAPKNIIITLSEKGVFYANEKSENIIPAHLRNISDVSGAGDTVIAVAAVIWSITNDLELTTKIANLAGGLVCEEVGVAPLNKEKLFLEITNNNWI